MAEELTATKLNPSGDSHLLLDQPLLKVPHELSRKTLRASHRAVERERDMLLAALKPNVVYPDQDQSQTLKSVDSMIARMEGLKRKLESYHAEERALHKQSRARIRHLQDLYEIDSLADVKYDQWSKVRLNRLLVDYLLRCGYGESAKALAIENNIEDLVDIDAFVQYHRVQISLQQRRVNECLAWCVDNKQSLKKLNSNLEFELRLQQYIELARSQQYPKLIEAQRHAQKYLTTHSDPKYPITIAGLLAFSPDTHHQTYTSLYSAKRWEILSDLFSKTHHILLSIPFMPALHVALSAGLSALKTPSCHSTHLSSSSNYNTASGASVCPICSTELHELARNVPYANHAKSNVENDPVVLPNGRVYGRERLLRFQEKVKAVEEGWIRDPTDPSVTFRLEEVKKVYIT